MNLRPLASPFGQGFMTKSDPNGQSAFFEVIYVNQR